MSLSAGGSCWGMGRAGHAVWVKQPSVAGGEGQRRPAGRHSQSISSKQGKLIPGPRMLLLGANTTLQLEPDAAAQSLQSWALQGRDQHRQGGRGSTTGTTSLLLIKREGDAQTGKLPDLGRQEQQLCSGGGMQSMETAQPPQHRRHPQPRQPWLEGLTGAPAAGLPTERG